MVKSIDDITPDEWNSVVSRSTDDVKPPNMGKLLIDKMQVGGSHYKSTNIQPWDVFIDWELDPWLCNVIKYVQRHNKKNGQQDLEKALHYLQFAISNYDKIRGIYYKKG